MFQKRLDGVPEKSCDGVPASEGLNKNDAEVPSDLRLQESLKMLTSHIYGKTSGHSRVQKSGIWFQNNVTGTSPTLFRTVHTLKPIRDPACAPELGGAEWTLTC